MSAPTTVAAKPALTPGLPFEQTLYERSPAGTFATTAILFALLFGSFLAIAALWHINLAARTVTEATSSAAWPALVLSLLCCAALAMQRYTRLWEIKDAPAYSRILMGERSSANDITGLFPSEARFVPATIAGILIGLVISVIIRTSEIAEGHQIPLGPMIWFAGATTFLTVLFARGVEMTRAGGRSYARVLNAELKIDLLRIDTLSVLGRSAARTSLIWFIVSAVACLFFIGGDLNALTILLIASCAIMGVGMFVITMGRIHRQILAAKAAELEHVRCQIEAARASLLADTHAATRLHGLIAFEKRIADAPEWPFDQSTLVRVGAYVLIPTVPWFGQAMVQYYVDHLGH